MAKATTIKGRRNELVTWLLLNFMGQDHPPTLTEISFAVRALTDENKERFLITILADTLRDVMPPKFYPNLDERTESPLVETQEREAVDGDW